MRRYDTRNKLFVEILSPCHVTLTQVIASAVATGQRRGAMAMRTGNFGDLRAFLAFLEERGELVRVREPVSTVLEMTEIHRRLIRREGPAVIFEKPVTESGTPAAMPVLVNLFGTVRRAAWGMGVEPEGLRALGEKLAFLRQPVPPRGLREAWEQVPVLREALSMRPKVVRRAPCQEIVREGAEADLTALPVQTCWPGEPAPLITWPLVVTRPPDARPEDTDRYNVGVYRMQRLGPRDAIMRWLAHRGGAMHHLEWKERGGDMPAAVAIGADPATIMAAVTPVPETLSEFHYAGLLRGGRGALVPARTQPLLVPANAEIVIEGRVSASETAEEGPYGDHTGYYNSVERFPVFHVTAVTMRRDPLYMSTFTGRPPDEPSVMAVALNEVFLPLLRQQFPEIVDFWLPPEGCSYRIGVAAIRKRYPGHARRVMMGLWSFLRQFSYTKLLIVVDEDVDPRSWEDVMWALSTRFDASRDVVILENTPIDYLDFASPREGLGGKLGLDATTKIGGETDREWGRVLDMDPEVVRRVDELWPKLFNERP